MLDIRLLGTPRVFLDGKPITIPRKATRALFFYLAMHPNGVKRELLAECFGGNGDGKKKRAILRRYLNHLRNSLGKEREFLINYHDIVLLDSKCVKVDALNLIAAAEEIHKNKLSYYDSGQTIPIALYQRVEEIVAELESDVFIESTDLDAFIDISQWKTAKDAELKNKQKALLAFLAETDSSLGRTGQALEWAKRALKFGESEGAYYALIKGFRDLGDFGKAQKYYQDAEEIFGYGLSTRIKALGDEIAYIGEASPLYARPVWTLLPSVSIPFVGQNAILQRMRANYQRGIGSLLVGETGAGKTRLAQQFFEKISMTPNLLLVPCYKDNENLPYQPWIDMLRHSFKKEFWQTTPVWWTNALTMLLPELHEYRDDLDAEPGDVFTNALVFESFKNLLAHAGEKSAALLFVEDAQWMDRVSFDLLKYLILQSTFKQWNIGLVVTSRFGINANLDRFKLGVIQGKIDEIEISPLNKEEIKQFAFCLLNEALSNEKAERLQKMTGGNPFFLLEMLGFQASHPDVDIYEDFFAAPLSVRQLITARLDILSSNTRKVLNYAAIQGNHFVLSTLEEVLTLLEKTLPILDEIEFFWIYLRAQRLYRTLLETLGRDTSQPRKKIKEMLAIVESSLGDAPLQDEWKRFSEKVRDK